MAAANGPCLLDAGQVLICTRMLDHPCVLLGVWHACSVTCVMDLATACNRKKLGIGGLMGYRMCLCAAAIACVGHACAETAPPLQSCIVCWSLSAGAPSARTAAATRILAVRQQKLTQASLYNALDHYQTVCLAAWL